MNGLYKRQIKAGSIVAIAFILLIITTTGCTKLIEVDPPIDEIIGEEIYKNDASAASVLTGIYIDMSSHNSLFTGRTSLSVSLGLSADELEAATFPEDILTKYYSNGLSNDDGGIWANLYALVFRTNAAIEGIEASKGLSDNGRRQLLGECRFLRAYMYFHLVNLFGDVPLLTTTDIKFNSLAARSASSVVYDKIVEDLMQAEELLRDEYVSANATSTTSQRLRPNRATANALLAKVYLNMEKWDLSEAEASKVISQAGVYQLETLQNVFLSGSQEAIWQLQPVLASINTLDAQVFILEDGNGVPAGPNGEGRPVFLSERVVSLFEAGDVRKDEWIGMVNSNGTDYYYPKKYKVWLFDEPVTEYLVLMRLADVYLIRAEARAHQGKLTGENSAASDVNALRQRAGATLLNGGTEAQLMEAIMQERQKELFCELGSRWFDLKRSKTIDQVMTIVAAEKGTTWQSYKALFPIPVVEIQKNPTLRGSQNPGYPGL